MQEWNPVYILQKWKTVSHANATITPTVVNECDLIYTKYVITKETTIIILATCWKQPSQGCRSCLVCESLGIFRFTSSKKSLKCCRSFTASSVWDVSYRSQNFFTSLICSSVCSDKWICTLISTRFKTRCVSLQKKRTRFQKTNRHSQARDFWHFGDFQRFLRDF